MPKTPAPGYKADLVPSPTADAVKPIEGGVQSSAFEFGGFPLKIPASLEDQNPALLESPKSASPVPIEGVRDRK